MSEEWGPRIDWNRREALPDGVQKGDWYRGVNCVMGFVEKRVENHHPVNWSYIEWFQIRKPRGLTMLENLIADLPAPVAPKVDA